MVNKYTSIKVLITKIVRDLNMTNDERIWDTIEWIAEGLEHIGSYNQYVAKGIQFELCDSFKYPIPCDLVKLTAMNTGGRPLSYLTGTMDMQDAKFFKQPYTQPVPKICGEFTQADGTPIFINCGTGNINNPNNVNGNETIATAAGNSGFTNTRPGYVVNGGWFNFNFSSGLVSLSYLGLLVDCDGYPMIPDMASVREALFKYVVMKFHYSKYILGQIPPSVYKDMQEDWHWYCSQARGEMNMPTLDKMESIKNNWLRLKPLLQQESYGFTDIGVNSRTNGLGAIGLTGNNGIL
jgi:hypothetical protein